MGQRSSTWVERRSEPRYPKAFAFWIRPTGALQRTSAWMLDLSTRGAAFLAPAAEVPALGARIELIEMLSPDRLVREGAGPLPPFARVLRHDDAQGVTRRVAVRFETDARAATDVRRQRTATMMCPQLPGAPPFVPPSHFAAGQAAPGRGRGVRLKRDRGPGD